MSQPYTASMYTPGPSKLPWGSTLGLQDFFKKNQDQHIDTLQMFYRKLTLDGSH